MVVWLERERGLVGREGEGETVLGVGEGGRGIVQGGEDEGKGVWFAGWRSIVVRDGSLSM